MSIQYQWLTSLIAMTVLTSLMGCQSPTEVAPPAQGIIRQTAANAPTKTETQEMDESKAPYSSINTTVLGGGTGFVSTNADNTTVLGGGTGFVSTNTDNSSDTM